MFVKQPRQKIISSHAGMGIAYPLARESVEEIVWKHLLLARGRTSSDRDPRPLDNQLTFRLTDLTIGRCGRRSSLYRGDRALPSDARCFPSSFARALVGIWVSCRRRSRFRESKQDRERPRTMELGRTVDYHEFGATHHPSLRGRMIFLVKLLFSAGGRLAALARAAVPAEESAVVPRRGGPIRLTRLHGGAPDSQEGSNPSTGALLIHHCVWRPGSERAGRFFLWAESTARDDSGFDKTPGSRPSAASFPYQATRRELLGALRSLLPGHMKVAPDGGTHSLLLPTVGKGEPIASSPLINDANASAPHDGAAVKLAPWTWMGLSFRSKTPSSCSSRSAKAVP